VAGLTQLVEFDPLAHTERKKNGTILVAIGTLSSETLFHNGLTQNALLLYDLFESMGYTSHLLVDKATNPSDPLARLYRTLLPETYVKTPFPVFVYIEIGMSLDVTWKDLLKAQGARLTKLYLGNILNIDVETTSITRGIYFPHHIRGPLDELWTSPHYATNLSYGCVLNGLSFEKGRIVPYVWDPRFIEGVPKWQASLSPLTMDLVIPEPNISFQKCGFYPLLLCNEFAKRCPAWTGRVLLQNTERLKENTYFMKTLLPTLFVCTEGRLVLKERQTLRSILKDNPGAAFVCHQVNNDYNYMFLELMTLDFPVLHNSQGWASFGYHWTEKEWTQALDKLYEMLVGHKDRLPAYRVQAAQVAWKHSIANPVIREEWARVLE
jgi:hypothetical protein